MKLSKGIIFSDIHWGRMQNADIHNQDCLDFITWLSRIVKKDSSIDHILFLGDWFENRSAIDSKTMNFAYKGAKLLSKLGLPIFFLVGNHDLYYRHSRDLHSFPTYEQLNNFNIIENPVINKDIGNGALLCPFIFQSEYKDLSKYSKLETWWGHFEFKGFVLTGQYNVMKNGPDHTDFKKQKIIASGHFHKRQSGGNVQYIGNTFPMDFGDANDVERGCMIYDHTTHKRVFHNWKACPKYTTTSISKLLAGKVKFHNKSKVKCLVDIPIDFNESNTLKQKYIEQYELRDFVFEETLEKAEALTDTEITVDVDLSQGIVNINDFISGLLNDIETDHFDNKLLVNIYNKL